MQERFYKVLGKVLKLWERLYHREKVGKVSKFQERLFNDNFKAGNGEERKGKGKLSVPPLLWGLPNHLPRSGQKISPDKHQL